MHDERGESLVEVLLAVAIIGVCFAAILAGVGTSATASGIKQDQALSANYLRAAAERVQAQDFQPCSAVLPTSYSLASVVPAGSQHAVSIVSIEHWDGAAFTASCPSADSLQRVTLEVVPPDGRAAEPRLTILKRKR